MDAEQIDKFQKYWDLLMAGDLEARRQLRFVPGDMKPLPLRPETSLFDQFDEWIARVVCYCFSLPPTAFVKQQNRATAETRRKRRSRKACRRSWSGPSLHEPADPEGLEDDDYVFAWADETSLDPLVQAQVDQIYVATGIRLPNDREDHGWEKNPVARRAEDTARADALLTTATLDKTTTAYSTTGETTGTGYAAGGLALSGFSVTLSGDTAQLTFSAAVWNASTMAGEGCLIYNSSRSNKAVCVLSFGGTVQDTNGTFTVTLPAALIGLT
jgi:hypothetical protein